MTFSTIHLSHIGNAAVAYADKYGWDLFPIRPGAKDPPLIKWKDGATSDTEQLTAMWTRWRKANLGLATGQRSRVVAVDVDPRNGGDALWDEILDQHGPVDTLQAVSGSGGKHVFFQAGDTPLSSAGNGLGKGIDLKAEGGYVLLAPSIHPNGNPYAWDTEAVPPAPIPEWLFALWPKVEPPPVNKRYGKRALPQSVQDGLADFLRSAALKPQRDGRFRGPCPFPHDAEPCDCPSAFVASPVSGAWVCYCSDHPSDSPADSVTGGPNALLPLAGIEFNPNIWRDRRGHLRLGRIEVSI